MTSDSALSPNPTRETKADLRRRFPKLLLDAASNAEARSAALRAALKIGVKVPAELLEPGNVAASLQPREIARSLRRLSTSTLTVDVSGALDAIRVSAAPRLSRDFRLARDLTRTVTKQLLELGSRGSALTSRVGREAFSGHSVRVTTETVRAAGELAQSLVVAVANSRGRKRPDVYPLVLRWLEAVEALWRGAPSDATLTVVKFERALSSVLSLSTRAQLRNDPKVVTFFEDSRSAMLRQAERALHEGRVDLLDALIGALAEDHDGQIQMLSTLQQVCRTRPFDMQGHAVQWVAQRVSGVAQQAEAPVAADESQSSALDLVSLSLLAAWDAASEGSRSAEAFERVRHMARELFKLEVVGNAGEVAPYDERVHDLEGEMSSRPRRVEVLRPGVQWSDGVRVRQLLRAVVKPAN